MELWFTERHTPSVEFSIKVDRQLYSSQSEFQRIDVFDSKEFGRFLTLDGYMTVSYTHLYAHSGFGKLRIY